MSLSGSLKTMDLAELLQWIALGRKTGSLAFVRNKAKNYIYFRDGQIISSRSNEPAKQLGQFLLFQGKITETQLKRAFEIHMQSRIILGRVLVQEGLVTNEDLEAALVARTREVIYDLFLWDDGYFHFAANGYDLKDLILVKMDINALIFEGVRRKDEWARIRSVFPHNDVMLAQCPGINLKLLALTPLQKKLLFLLTLKKSISEIVLELHGSEFQVNFALFQLFDQDIIEIKEIQQPAVVADDPGKIFSKGLELAEKGKHREAISVFQEVLRIDPQNVPAHEQIEQAEAAICQEYYQSAIPGAKVPYFLVPESSLQRCSLTHEEGFVASRINGTWDVKSIVMLSPLREIEILQVLDKLMKMQLIALK
jgi:tetratricopeptide (TPR) repeat protein